MKKISTKKIKKQAVKKNTSSMQVLKTLQVLLEGNYSMAQLIQKLNENEPKPIFNNSVISKYINTCRYVGINIPKINNKYFVAHLPFGLDLTLNDLSVLKKLQETAEESMSTKSCEKLGEFLDKLSKFSNKNILRVEKGQENEFLNKFEEAITQNRKIQLLLKAAMTLECIPIEITKHKGKTFLKVFHENQEKLIFFDRVKGLEILNDRFSQNFPETTVVYKLKGDLAKRYRLRDNERIINTEYPDVIVVSNKGEDKEVLLSRLLRYDSLCKITSPKSYCDEMKSIIEQTLANYGE